MGGHKHRAFHPSRNDFFCIVEKFVYFLAIVQVCHKYHKYQAGLSTGDNTFHIGCYMLGLIQAMRNDLFPRFGLLLDLLLVATSSSS